MHGIFYTFSLMVFPRIKILFCYILVLSVLENDHNTNNNIVFVHYFLQTNGVLTDYRDSSNLILRKNNYFEGVVLIIKGNKIPWKLKLNCCTNN